MLQVVDGHEVFVVDLKTVPEGEITWNTPEERPWALALQAAIQDGHITEPGKYGLQVSLLNGHVATYQVARIYE